jgi:hypothetical protein
MESTDSSALCDICDTAYTDKAMLRRHKYEYHSIPDPIPFQGGTLTVERTGEKGVMKCPISDCERAYQTRSRLMHHMASHQGDLPRGSTAVRLVEEGSEASKGGQGRPVFPSFVSVADLIDCGS